MQRPIVLLATLHLAGLVLGARAPMLGGWVAVLALSLCLATVAGALRRRELDAGSRWLFAAVLVLGVWQGARVETAWREATAALAPLGDGHAVQVRGRLAREPHRATGSVTLALFPAVLASRTASAEARLPVEVRIPEGGDQPLDLSALALGDLVEAEGFLLIARGARNPGGFDHQAWQWQRGVAGTVGVAVRDTVRITTQTPNLWGRYLRWSRGASQRLAAALGRQQGPEAAAFSRALLLGDRQALDPSDRHAFLLTGLGHLFAVSGLHTAMLFSLLLGALRLARCPWRLSLGLAAAALVPYAILVGCQPSVIRAVVMIAALVAGRLIGRTVDHLSALALAALAIGLVDPRAPWQPGFQMSFLAVLALVLHAPVLRDLLPDDAAPSGGRAARWLWARLALPALAVIGIHLALLPVQAEVYRLWSWIAVPTNLLLVPLSFLIQLGGVAALGLGALWPAGGDWLGWATAGLVHAMFALVRAFAAWPGAAVSISPLPWPLVALWCALLFGGPGVQRAVALDERLRRRARWALAWLALTALAIWAPLLRWQGAARMRVTFLDVGQGDATLIEMPAGPTVVVDGGRRTPVDHGLRVIEPALRARGIDALDLVVATHADADHIGGLIHLLRRFPVRAVAEGDPRGATATLAEFRDTVAASGARHLWLARGARVSDGMATITILNPDPDPARRPADTNNNSLVLALDWREAEILIMGDAEMPAERAILAAAPGLRCDVLRTGHHGSRRGTGAEFLAAVRPAAAILSVGRHNPYGHPHPDVLRRLADAHVHTLRTDALGALTLETDGWTLWLTAGGAE